MRVEQRRGCRIILHRSPANRNGRHLSRKLRWWLSHIVPPLPKLQHSRGSAIFSCRRAWLWSFLRNSSGRVPPSFAKPLSTRLHPRRGRGCPRFQLMCHSIRSSSLNKHLHDEEEVVPSSQLRRPLQAPDASLPSRSLNSRMSRLRSSGEPYHVSRMSLVQLALRLASMETDLKGGPAAIAGITSVQHPHISTPACSAPSRGVVKAEPLGLITPGEVRPGAKATTTSSNELSRAFERASSSCEACSVCRCVCVCAKAVQCV